MNDDNDMLQDFFDENSDDGLLANKSGLSIPENPNPLDPYDERFYPGGEFDAASDIYEAELDQPMQGEHLGHDEEIQGM